MKCLRCDKQKAREGRSWYCSDQCRDASNAEFGRAAFDEFCAGVSPCFLVNCEDFVSVHRGVLSLRVAEAGREERARDSFESGILREAFHAIFSPDTRVVFLGPISEHDDIIERLDRLTAAVSMLAHRLNE